MKGYFAEFEEVFMCLMTYFFCHHKRHVIQMFLKSLVFSKQNAAVLRFEIVCDKSYSVTPVFTALILLPLFQIIKTPQCCGFTFTNFFLFSYGHQCPCNQLSNFFEYCFSYFVIWFSHGSLMEINSTSVFQK